MKKWMRKTLLVLLVPCFLVSGILVVHQLQQYRAAVQVNEAAKEMAEPITETILPSEPVIPLEALPVEEQPVQKTLPEEAAFLMDLDLDTLRETNERVLGWIHIPDSELSYPLLNVKDNQEYLRRAWDGTPNSAGCIFLECRNDPGFEDFNTMIYGHYMRNGTMFGSLHDYKDQDYAENHPVVYILTDDKVRCYEVFAAYEADVVSNTYRLYFEDDERKKSVLEEYMAQNVLETELVPTIDDHILTLSTCTGTGTYDTRWVVQAVLSEVYEKQEAEPRVDSASEDQIS